MEYFIERDNCIPTTNKRNVFLLLALFLNCLFLFFEANWGDIGYWREWIRQLAVGGYEAFDGNYPPVYLHWLYLIAKIYSFLSLDIENSLFLKVLAVMPVILGHLLFVGLLHHLMTRNNASPCHYKYVMFLSAVNPALLLDGPVWGQIDILPLLPIVAALFVSVDARWRVLTLPIAFSALLVKFQAIAFLPVFGIIFFRDIRAHLIGVLLCLPVFLIAYSPFIVSGTFTYAFKNAYVNVLSQYSATTMGASNIWILLTGNAAPDSTLLFGVSEQSSFSLLFKAKNFGIFLFAIASLLIFLKGMGRYVVHRKNDEPELIRAYFFYAMACAIVFFTFLPAMHERYLIPAVVVSLVYYAFNARGVIYAITLTFVSCMNLLMTLGLKTNGVWPSISWFCVFACILVLMDLTFSDARKKIISLSMWALSKKYIALVCGLISFLSLLLILYLQVRPIKPLMGDNRQLLTELRPISSKQDYGVMRVNKNVSGEPLSVGSRQFTYGFGVHANSEMSFQLPLGAQKMEFLIGLDDGVESASVFFSVYGDGEKLWQSSPVLGRESAQPIVISVVGVSVLVLKVDGMGGIVNDHANWLNPVLTFDDR